ncbi:MAG: sulfatase [Bryobacterales bacterium]|nr:sulfatase [Bryobacterales bacterium]
MTTHRALGVQTWLSAILGLATLLPAIASARPNIVLAIADDWGWPHASAYGDTGVETPSFDRLAREGVLLEHAYISSPSCTPSRGAIITGQQFFRLGPAGNLWSVWPSGLPEYPRLLTGEGYFVGSYRKGWGPGIHPGTTVTPAGRRYASVEEFFEARPDGTPFCLWFGASDPHRPYEPGSGRESGIAPEDVHLFEHYPDVKTVRSDVADYYFEVQRFDRDVGDLLELLETMGELDNTLVVMTGDHGMPFPRGKGNLYDSGARVPMAIMWKASIPGGRVLTDFVSTTDLAPTFLTAAGLRVPGVMTGRSLLPILTSADAGRVSSERDHVIFGRERHVIAQEAPDLGGYPSRGIRTDEFLYIRNYEPERWPAGTPDHERAQVPNAWLADCDNGPTKWFLWQNRDNPRFRRFYDLAFAKRPAEELYDLSKDPGQVVNVAGEPEYLQTRKELAVRLAEALIELGDPRIQGRGSMFDVQPYLGGSPRFPTE